MRPLEGVTVLDLTRVVAGPFATMIMADLGARVIKIENPRDPDYTRDFEPYLIDDDKRQSAFFAQYNRNKEAITLNLKEEKAKEIFRELAKKADIVVENYRAGVMDKLGVGYEDLRRYNPKLVYTAISGFGQKGPYSSWPAYDNSGQALSGLWSLNGMPGEPSQNRHYNRRSGSYFLWDYRNFGRIYSCAEDRQGTAGRCSAAGFFSGSDRKRRIQLYCGKSGSAAAGQRSSSLQALRKIQGQRRICVFRRLYRQILEDYL